MDRFVREIRRRIDDNNQSYWLNFTASRWLAIRLEFLSYSIVFVSTVFAVVSRGSLSPGVAGLAISYSLNITSILNIFIRGYTDLETNFVSIERVIEYTEVEKEVILNNILFKFLIIKKLIKNRKTPTFPSQRWSGRHQDGHQLGPSAFEASARSTDRDFRFALTN